MKSPLADPWEEALRTYHRVYHTMHGESPSLNFLGFSETDGAIDRVLFTLDTGWAYRDRWPKTRIPGDVRFELRIAETLLSWQDFQNYAAIQHGPNLFAIVEPSPFAPKGVDRFWRFYLNPWERADEH